MRKPSGLGDGLHHPAVDALFSHEATLIYHPANCTQWLLRTLCVLRPAKHIYVGYPTTTYNNEVEQVDNQLLCQRAVLMS
jgi:hypothetical protein